MKKIGIIIFDRYKNCGGGKCFKALEERVGGFYKSTLQNSSYSRYASHSYEIP